MDSDVNELINRTNLYTVPETSGASYFRGIVLRRELHQIIDGIHQLCPEASIRVEDRYGILVCKRVGSQHGDSPPKTWDSHPIRMHNRPFGTMWSSIPIRYFTQLEMFQTLLLRFALVITEWMEWAETEAERRGEKLQNVLNHGLTMESKKLLSMCGLSEDSGYTLVAMELSSQSDRFQSMDILRRFMLAHMWGYSEHLNFIAYRPDGLIALFPGSDIPTWTSQSQEWCHRWDTYQEHSESTLGVRVYVLTIADLDQLHIALKEVELVMNSAARLNSQGIIQHQSNRTITHFLSNLSPNALKKLVEETLGALLYKENQYLMETLRVYLLMGQSATQTAKTLYLHRNTLLYRIRNIEQLLGMHLYETENLTAIWTALQALDLLGLAGDSIRT